MNIEVDKEDLINLIVSCSPSYKIMENLKGLGTYYGGFDDKWIWNKSAIRTLSEDELINLYKNLK
jgi:hypothetical protein